MTDEKLARFKGHKWYAFWAMLKQGYDYFEVYRVPPPIAVCEKKYVVGVTLPASGRIDPAGRCPRFQKPLIEPFNPDLMDQQIADQRIVVPGSKARDATALAWSDGSAPPPPSPAAAAPLPPATGSIDGASAPVVAPLTAGAETPRKPPQKSHTIPATLGLNQP
jgi:hypothetical protein